jgi:hypothetical protein
MNEDIAGKRLPAGVQEFQGTTVGRSGFASGLLRCYRIARFLEKFSGK